MSSVTVITCDGCGVTIRDDDEGQRDRNVRGQATSSALFSSIDPEMTKGGYRWRSCSWDFCGPCGTKAVVLVSEQVGPPHHTSLEDYR